MGNEEDVLDEFEGLPANMRAAVERWFSEATTTPGEPAARIWSRYIDHPDWPMVNMWLRTYRSPDKSMSAIQDALRSIANTRALIEAHVEVSDSAANGNSKKRRVVMPPALTLARFARFLLTKDAFKRYVEPHIADVHHEYFEALAAGQSNRAKWVVVLGYMRVLQPLAAGIWATVRALWKMSGA